MWVWKTCMPRLLPTCYTPAGWDLLTESAGCSIGRMLGMLITLHLGIQVVALPLGSTIMYSVLCPDMRCWFIGCALLATCHSLLWQCFPRMAGYCQVVVCLQGKILFWFAESLTSRLLCHYQLCVLLSSWCLVFLVADWFLLCMLHLLVALVVVVVPGAWLVSPSFPLGCFWVGFAQRTVMQSWWLLPWLPPLAVSLV